MAAKPQLTRRPDGRLILCLADRQTRQTAQIPELTVPGTRHFRRFSTGFCSKQTLQGDARHLLQSLFLIRVVTMVNGTLSRYVSRLPRFDHIFVKQSSPLKQQSLPTGNTWQARVLEFWAPITYRRWRSAVHIFAVICTRYSRHLPVEQTPLYSYEQREQTHHHEDEALTLTM